MTKVNSHQPALNHVLESYISQIDNVTQVNQDMKARLLGTNKDEELLRKELNKPEAKFAGGEKKIDSLERKLQSKQLIRNLNRKLIYKDNRIRSQKLEITQLKVDVRKLEKECLQIYGLIRKITDQLGNHISNFAR